MTPDKQVRIIFFADTHLGFDYPIRPRSSRRRRGEDFFDNHRKVLAYAKENDADLVIHGGDLFFRSKIPKKIVDLVYETLLSFAASGIDLVLVPGNHERSHFPDSLFLCHHRIHIFRKPGTFDFEFRGCRISVSGFPCVRDQVRDDFPKILTDTGWENRQADIRLLVMHQAIDGASVGPSNFVFRNHEDVVAMNDLPEAFTAVLSGHIHRQQVLEGKNGLPVIYPGSIERTSFAEKDEEKGFFDLTFISDASGSGRLQEMRFVPLPARPMIDLEVDTTLEEDATRAILGKIISDLDPDSIVRIKPMSTDAGQKPMSAPFWTNSFFKELFPETMNFQLSGSFFRKNERRRKQ